MDGILRITSKSGGGGGGVCVCVLVCVYSMKYICVIYLPWFSVCMYVGSHVKTI